MSMMHSEFKARAELPMFPMRDCPRDGRAVGVLEDDWDITAVRYYLGDELPEGHTRWYLDGSEGCAQGPLFLPAEPLAWFPI